MDAPFAGIEVDGAARHNNLVDGRRVLVVEDPLVRRLIRGVLTRGGYPAVEAEPRRALELLADPAEGFAMIVTNEPNLFFEFAGSIPVLYVAAVPKPEWVEKLPRCRTLLKPFHPKDLIELTRELLEMKSRAAAV